LSLRIPVLLSILVCVLLTLGGISVMPIQAGDQGIVLAGGMEESLIFNLAIEEAGSKSIEVNELNSSQVVNEVEEDSVVVAEIPAQEIPKVPALESGYWGIFGIILGICSLLVVVVIYLIKQKKI
jgi:hypothetical protein